MNIEEIKEFYKNHSIGDTSKYFNITYYKLKKLFKQYNIVEHTYAENVKLNNLNHGNSFANKQNKLFDDYIKTIDKDVFEHFYKENAVHETAKHYHITEGKVFKILEYFGIKKLSPIESKKISFKNKYGSFEDGFKIVSEKIKNNTDWEKQKQKRYKTCLEKYGVETPFQSKDIQEKTKQTCLKRYGVDNPFKADFVKAKIKETSMQRYGGIGWSSEYLREKYTSTMSERYGVDWGCLLPQCLSSNNGCNSKPNLFFKQKLIENNLDIESNEFILDQYKYDFKINNTLIEINPSYTHSIDVNYRNFNIKIDSSYHQNKKLKALEKGFNCINIWDWDNIDLIIKLLTPKKYVYARKCISKEISNEEAKLFLLSNHLQGYIKAEINLGLFYNNELVSVMTFGKPRYNKKYEYELLRYCESCNIAGGANKLFAYFLKKYNPNSIISYCDLSKFSGKVYLQLGFTELNKKPKPSIHWYNLKTKRHITDNLLRQRGYDQLFGTNYGKGTSNEELMLNNGFIRICDCGQKTYIYNKN